ncbi:MAG: HD domain-containing protein [Acidobacteria bacterium]|nr:HD domain-containing protein [Acidobacteriota bacterium]
MSDPVRFLNAFAQTLSVMTLYPEGHPSRERVVDAAFEDLDALCADGQLPLFTFLEGEVVYGRQPLRDLRGWEWSARLAECGVGRLEFERRMTRDEFEGFLQEIQIRLMQSSAGTSAQRQMRDLGVRFGAVGLDLEPGPAAPTVHSAVTGLREEVDTLHWMQGQVLDGGAIPIMEAEAVVRSLSIAMHADSGMLLPLLQLKEFDQYTTTHSLNVSVLAMALAEALALSPREVRAMGVSGLLHDVGKTKIPLAVLTKAGKLTDEERQLMNRHPSDGARMILQSDADLDLAAVVAYEHHIMLDGGGYPALHYGRGCTFGSRLVHVCDVYDALSTRRPYREAWPQAKTLAYLEERAGTEFDPFLVHVFARLMKDGEARVQRLDALGALPAV